MAQYLLAQNTVNGAEGSIILTIDGKNQVIAGMKNITVEAEINTEEMKVIGTRKTQDKPAGAKLTGSGNVYYGFTAFTDMVLKYIKTGVPTPFSIQITNDDAAAGIGQQVMAYYDCTLSGTIPLSVLDSEESMLNYDFEFTVGDVEQLQGFTEPTRYGN